SYAILNASAPNCGNCTYTWSTGAEGTSTWTFVGGDYNVTVSNGCPPDATSATVTVIEDSEIFASTSTTNTTANGSCDGSASVSATGGTPPYTYSWSNNATTQTVSGLCAGNYSVTITDAGGCGVYSNVTISQPVSISESSSDFHFNIFPNPNNGIFTLEFLSFPSEKIELSVFNLLGETIYRQNISELKSPIDLSKNPCGIYFIQIKIGKEISNKLLIKQ
ncbi:MAG TPA: T9SS type A sorting domain-containing protein, partial [Chitinophagaceae bacterium]|nr:T9SS type A sorting domain-containing protein [Chitinophagaceae bacterium]